MVASVLAETLMLGSLKARLLATTWQRHIQPNEKSSARQTTTWSSPAPRHHRIGRIDHEGGNETQGMEKCGREDSRHRLRSRDPARPHLSGRCWAATACAQATRGKEALQPARPLLIQFRAGVGLPVGQAVECCRVIARGAPAAGPGRHPRSHCTGPMHPPAAARPCGSDWTCRRAATAAGGWRGRQQLAEQHRIFDGELRVSQFSLGL